MERLLPNFDVYDLLAYFVPGGIMLLLFYVVFSNFYIGFNMEITGIFEIISASVIMICVLFALGFLIQSIGGIVDRKFIYNKKFRYGSNYPSIDFLKDENEHYTTEF